MRLFAILEEQFNFGFDGRINFLRKDTKQFLGVIYQREGLIVDASYQGANGKNAMIKLVLLASDQDDQLNYVVEPEIVSDEHNLLSLDFETFKQEFEDYKAQYDAAKKLRPPDNLKMIINGDFIIKGTEIEPGEFDILAIISDYSRVKDIYDHCGMPEFEVTNGLVSLRKKGAIKVVSN